MGIRLLWAATGLALAALVGVLDVATGYELSFGLFYLCAIGVTAWKSGRPAGLFLAIVCAAVWFVADRAAGHVYAQPLIAYWNAGIRLGFFLVVAVLLAELHRALDREQAVARIDTLTEAANRRQLLERLDEELERSRRHARPLTLAYVDLDHFKEVNDHLGHAAGDEVLRVVARTLRRRLRKTDTVARFGGDEFAVLMPESDEQAAHSAIDAARVELLEQMGRHGWPVTFSIGVVTTQDGRVGNDEFVREADELMYRVKKEGKNRVLSATLEASTEDRVELNSRTE